MRHQRHGADAEHLRKREHDEHRGAGRADTGERRVAQLRDEVEVHDVIQRLQEHARGDRRRHADQLPVDRAVREVLHAEIDRR